MIFAMVYTDTWNESSPIDGIDMSRNSKGKVLLGYSYYKIPGSFCLQIQIVIRHLHSVSFHLFNSVLILFHYS